MLVSKCIQSLQYRPVHAFFQDDNRAWHSDVRIPSYIPRCGPSPLFSPYQDLNNPSSETIIQSPLHRFSTTLGYRTEEAVGSHRLNWPLMIRDMSLTLDSGGLTLSRAFVR